MKPLVLVVLLALSPGNVPAANVILKNNGKPAAEYHAECAPFKPYVAQLYSPSGVGVLRDNVADHLHHHGLMFALGVNGVDFWSEKPTCGKQVERQLETSDKSLTQYLDWTSPDGKVLMIEERIVKAHQGPVTLLTWRSRLSSKDEVALTGSHYFGLGMRFVTEMDKIAQFMNSANATGDVVRRSERLTSAKWNACIAHGVTVALFDHPSNLRHPSRMFTMNAPFAYQSATLNLWKEPFTLKEPLDLRYGVAVWDGEQAAEEIERQYQRWLKDSGTGVSPVHSAKSQTGGTPVPPPSRVLIFSGQNNHKWQETTPKLKAILESSHRFTVDVTEHPEQCDAATFAKYDVILSNWNTWTKNAATTNWPAATRAAFLDFVRSGKGSVAVHAGSSSFFDWTEYQQICGATWKLGQTHHGKPHQFTVKSVSAHPITDGLQPFTATDELWRKPGVAPGATVIATGDDEPLVLVTSFGKGRGFTTLLGHDAEKMDNPGFKTLLVRGVEWAATSKVTKPDLLKAIAGYKFGDDRSALLEVERAVMAAPGEWSPKLAKLLASDATLDCKKFVCWQLSLCGTTAQVPALEKLLTNPDLAFAARSALERIRGEKLKAASPSRLAERIARMAKDRDLLLSGLKSSDEAALRALRATKDAQTLRAVAQLPNLSAPMLTALAEANETSALSAAVKAASSDDPTVRRAAVDAIGALGNASSVPALVGLLEHAERDDRKLIGDALARLRGPGVDAALAKTTQPETIRALVARNAKSSVPALLELAKAGNSEAISALGKLADDGAPLIALLGKDGVESALVAIYRRTGNIQPLIDAATGAKKAPILAVLGALGGEKALAVLRAALKDDDAEVKLAAVRALSNWETAAPLADLQTAAASATDAKLKALAERGVARLESLGFDVKGKQNLARGAMATNPDGLKPDGQGSPAPAAIDGNLKTYWDEVNDQKLYQLRIQMKQTAVVRAIRITGYRQHDYAPKDFDVLCDEKVVKSVKDAQYQDNTLVVTLPATQCTTIQLNITGYYSRSPAIRELEIYGKE